MRAQVYLRYCLGSSYWTVSIGSKNNPCLPLKKVQIVSHRSFLITTLQSWNPTLTKLMVSFDYQAHNYQNTLPISPLLHNNDGHPHANYITEGDCEAGISRQHDLEPNNSAHGLGISNLDDGSSPTIPGSANLLVSPTSTEVE